MDITYDDIFKNQKLTLDKKDQEKLKRSAVAIAGIGGTGTYITEFLARNGIGRFFLADQDKFEPYNARQLYQTIQTLQKNKAVVAKERVAAINPNAEVKVFAEGITPFNHMDFCQSADVIIAQTDLITSQLLLYRAAMIKRLPIIRAGRAEWPNRHLVSVSVYDFRDSEGKFKLERLSINPRKWGVKNIEILRKFIAKVEKGEECAFLMEKINFQNKLFRIKSFKQVLKNGELESISEKSREYLLKVSKQFPQEFYEMAITPELCAVSGALAATVTKNLILDRPVKKIAIDLYHGKAFTIKE